MTTMTSLPLSDDEQVEDAVDVSALVHDVSNDSSHTFSNTTEDNSTQESDTISMNDLSRHQETNPVQQQAQQLELQLKQVREEVAKLQRKLHALQAQSNDVSGDISTPDSTQSDETDLARMLLMENDYSMYFAAAKRIKKKKQKAIRSESMEKLLMAEEHLTALTKEHELEWASKLAKVQFDHIKTSTELQNNQVHKRIYQMSGHTINEKFRFNVLLHVRETDKSILALKLGVGRKMQVEMQACLTEMETNHQLVKFFRMIVDYAQLDRMRYSIYYELIHKYVDVWQPVPSELVEQQKDTEWTDALLTSMAQQAAEQVTLQFNGPGTPYPKLLFIWEMHVMALHWHDDAYPIERMPEQFELLVKRHGPLVAMEQVIDRATRHRH
ncbi:hypothetical protein BDF22DRAFT_27982 [Syncephalis plumigaleata]|nr:hypothetical protein BDF22DRAFT_27982 [Syncephalis plumigaleata]